jgi:predicted Na+-dependent transporter
VAALTVAPGGSDFSQLQPLWLAEALFVVLPVLVVATFTALVERWLRPDSWFLTATAARVLPLLVLWALGGIGLLVVVPLFLTALLRAALGRRRPAVPAALRRAGQALLVLIAGTGLWSLVSDTAEILG